MRRSRGFTLIELLVVAGTVAVLFTSVGITLHTLAQVNHTIHRELPQTETVMRLTLRLREDAHAAAAASVEAKVRPGDSLRLTRPGQPPIVYEIQSTTIVRRQLRGDSPDRSTVYRLRAGSDAAWNMAAEQPRQIELRMRRPVESRTGRGQAVRVTLLTAAVGLDPGVR